MTTTDRCIRELELAGMFDPNGEVYGDLIGKSVKELLLVFQDQGHSGYSASITSTIFKTLVDGKILSPLTNDESEWMEVTDGLWQNRRCYFVFKDANGAYTLDGKAFSDDGGKTWFTNKDSRVYFTLPGYPPETERVILDRKEEV